MSLRLAAVLIAACTPQAAAANCTQVDQLSLQLPRPIQPEYAGFVVPNSEHITGAPSFADECLQVKVQGGGTGFDPLQELKDGKADLAIAEGSYVAQQISKGEALTVVAGYYQKNGLVWIGKNKSHFPSLQALASKKVGVWCCGYDLAFPAIMSTAQNTITTSKIAQNPQSLQQLISGDVDLASAMVYDELGRLLQTVDPNTNFLKQQSELYVLNPESYGLTLVHNVLVVKTSELTSMRQKIVRFLKVVTKTWNFCRRNEAECASAFSEYGIATPHHLWQMREINRFIFPALPGYGLGVLSLERWAAMNKWLVASGALGSAVSNNVVDNTLVLEAGALEDISQWTPSTDGVFFCAQYGSTSPRLCQGNEHTLCPSGQEPTGPTDNTDCKKCGPGRFATSAARMNTCLVCPSGRYSRTSGQSECNLCQPGRFWASTPTTLINASASDCTLCAVGRFANGEGMTECMSCGQGTSASKEGTSECDRCPFGRYGDATAQSECKLCQASKSTMMLGAVSPNECVCKHGFYQSQQGSVCKPCPEGMSCKRNSLEKTLLQLAADPSLDPSGAGEFPRLQPGYYSLRSKPFVVYQCKDDKNCPGNVPEQCSGAMHGLACGQCDDGYYRDGSKCLKCTPTDESPFNYPLLQVIFGPLVVLVMYFFMRHGKNWGNWVNELASCTFTLAVHYQIIGIFLFTFAQYPDFLASVLTPFTYLVDIPNILRLSCSGYEDFRNSLIVKETAPALMLAIVALTYGVCYCIGQVFPLLGIEDTLGVRRVFPLQANLVINLYFAIFHTFFVTVCFIALQFFMCYEHPSGDWSLLFGPEVLCYVSAEWNGMITESIFAILGLIVAPILGFSYILWLAPSRFHDAGFRERWKFLFIKFKPESYSWGIVHMLRTLLLCLTLVFSQKGNRQIYYMFIMLLVYVAGLVFWFPWRHRSANLFDLVVSCMLLFFCALSIPFSTSHGWIDDNISDLATAVTFSPLVLVVVLLLWIGWRRLSPGSISAQEANMEDLAARCRAVFAKFVSLPSKGAQEFMHNLSAQDRDVMRSACAVIVAELLGHQPGETGLPWRLVHEEPKSGALTWSPANVSSNAVRPDSPSAKDRQ
jgi:ABC-type nitrate/sulfonate/bicarbonate transport system substrate-binding protein